MWPSLTRERARDATTLSNSRCALGSRGSRFRMSTKASDHVVALDAFASPDGDSVSNPLQGQT